MGIVDSVFALDAQMIDCSCCGNSQEPLIYLCIFYVFMVLHSKYFKHVISIAITSLKFTKV